MIAVVSFYYYNGEGHWCNEDILKEYCDGHGYELHFSKIEVDGYGSNIHTPTYDGIVYMRKLMDEGYDSVFWFDSTDIIITNPKLRLEDMISDSPIHFSNDVITNDVTPIYQCNSGFWCVDSSDHSKTFLDEVISTYDSNVKDGWSEEFWSDQNALNSIGEKDVYNIDTTSLKQSYWFYHHSDFYNMGIIDLVEYLGNQSKNKNTYKSGDFLIHFAGRVLPPNEMLNIYHKIKDLWT